jgi:hypothetical protein
LPPTHAIYYFQIEGEKDLNTLLYYTSFSSFANYVTFLFVCPLADPNKRSALIIGIRCLEQIVARAAQPSPPLHHHDEGRARRVRQEFDRHQDGLAAGAIPLQAAVSSAGHQAGGAE